jgi:hypothetical protein
VAVYEPPVIVAGSHAARTPDYRSRLAGHVSAGRRGDAVKLFLTEGTDVPRWVVTLMSFFPMWKRMRALAHTLPYDAIAMVGTQSGGALPADRWAALTAPALVVDGGKSPAWMHNGVQALVELLPYAEHVSLEGQTHIVKPAVLAPVLAAFFTA